MSAAGGDTRSRPGGFSRAGISSALGAATAAADVFANAYFSLPQETPDAQ